MDAVLALPNVVVLASPDPGTDKELRQLDRVARAIRDTYEELPDGTRPEFTEVFEWHEEARAALDALRGGSGE